jgi:hypothetical protein
MSADEKLPDPESVPGGHQPPSRAVNECERIATFKAIRKIETKLLVGCSKKICVPRMDYVIQADQSRQSLSAVHASGVNKNAAWRNN